MAVAGPKDRDTTPSDESGAHVFPPTETSPLLLTRTASTAYSTVSVVPQFLIEKSKSRFWIIFSQVLLAHFIGFFDATLTASAHPVITAYFGTAELASWLSTSFLLTLTAFQPLWGRLSDTLGRKPMFLGTLFILTLSTIWCALAGSMESLIAARAVAGIGAGGLSTVAWIVVSDLIPIERRGFYQAFTNATYGLASSTGAAFGGIMAEKLGWRWLFGVQVPVMVFCFGIAFIAIPNDLGLLDGRKPLGEALKMFDIKGSILLTFATGFLIFSLNLGGNLLPWSHPLVISSLAIFAICTPLFFWVEARASQPIIPLEIIGSRPRSQLLIGNAIAAGLSHSILFNMPIYFQGVLLTSATSSGLRLIILTAVASIGCATTGIAITLSRRLKWAVITGAVSYVIGTSLLSSLTRNMPGIVSSLILIAIGLGMAFQFPGTFLSILAVSSQSEQAVVTATLLLCRNLGQTLGISLSSLIVQNGLLHYLREFVHGERKDEIISIVRHSIQSVRKLDEPYRAQVVSSYEAALRLMFICLVGLSVFSLAILATVKLPRLEPKKIRRRK